jgi:hypothetical protein
MKTWHKDLLWIVAAACVFYLGWIAKAEYDREARIGRDKAACAASNGVALVTHDRGVYCLQ